MYITRYISTEVDDIALGNILSLFASCQVNYFNFQDFTCLYLLLLFFFFFFGLEGLGVVSCVE